jgi:DNA-binding NtrC family response regulator
MATILLVDDEPAVLDFCRAALRLGGHEVLRASNGQAALKLLENVTSAIDIALLDVVMPVMNGVELAKRIQSAYPNIRVVLMTGYALEEVERVVGDVSPYRIIFKPFKAQFLLQIIENVLENAASGGERGGAN